MNTTVKQFEDIILPYCAGLFILLCILAPRLANTIGKILNPASSYLIGQTTSWILICVSICITTCILFIAKLSNDAVLKYKTCILAIWCNWLALLGVWICDLSFIYIEAISNYSDSPAFSSLLSDYLSSQKWYYLTNICFIFLLNALVKDDNNKFISKNKSTGIILKIFVILIPLSLLFIPICLNLYIFHNNNLSSFTDLAPSLINKLNLFYLVGAITIILFAIYKAKKDIISIQSLLQIIHISGLTSVWFFVFQAITNILPYLFNNNISILNRFAVSGQSIKVNIIGYSSNLFLLLVLTITNKYYKKVQLTANNNAFETSGIHGTAKWADEKYLKKEGFYNLSESLIGVDDKSQKITYPICNRTIIANSGGGKSSGCLIPALLTEDRPVFVFDPKGELWAVTARQRAFGFGRSRKVITIDPFQILQKEDLSKNKPDELRIIYKVNPLDYISKDPLQRDRQLTNIASSCVVRESKTHSQHWYEYAEIFIKGLIEFIIDYEKPENINLVTVKDYLLKNKEHTSVLIDAMQSHGGKHAKATAAMLQNIGDEEKGSIWSTTYRQLSWISDENTMLTFNESNIDLRDFIKGDMDIFVILPEDQIQQHSRLIRLIFTSIINILSQTEPTQLPKTKFLFILDELGQLGASEDVQRAIEILRYKQVIIWAVFQNFGQIKLYQKPENFMEAQIKQFFSTDDIATMEWVQKLAGQKTVRVNSIAQNTNISSKHSSIIFSNLSSSDNISVQEVGVPLLHINQIREMNKDHQIVFIKGIRPLLCKRIFYYKDNSLNILADPNPYVQ